MGAAGGEQGAVASAEAHASEIALNGVRDEAGAGQRITLDVLNARLALVTTQHDRMVASCHMRCSTPSAGCRRRSSSCRPRSTIRVSIIGRSATAGTVFTRPTDADRHAESEREGGDVRHQLSAGKNSTIIFAARFMTTVQGAVALLARDSVSKLSAASRLRGVRYAARRRPYFLDASQASVLVLSMMCR